jgi:hypothetical protein
MRTTPDLQLSVKKIDAEMECFLKVDQLKTSDAACGQTSQKNYGKGTICSTNGSTQKVNI